MVWHSSNSYCGAEDSSRRPSPIVQSSLLRECGVDVSRIEEKTYLSDLKSLTNVLLNQHDGGRLDSRLMNSGVGELVDTRFRPFQSTHYCKWISGAS